MLIDVINKEDVPIEGIKNQKLRFADLLRALRSHEALRIPNQPSKIMVNISQSAYKLNMKIDEKECKWHTRIVQGILYIWKGLLPQLECPRCEVEVQVIKKKLPIKV